MGTVAIAGQVFMFGICLYQQIDTRLIQSSPTLAVGDFQRSINGAAFANLDNAPTVTPAADDRVEVTLSVAETTAATFGGEILVKWEDQVGAEWCSGFALVKVHSGEPETLIVTNTVNYLMQQAAIAAALRSLDLTIYRGDTWTQTLSGLGDLTAATDIWFGIKADPDDTDAISIVLISQSVGLEIINGAVGTPANGSIAVVGAATDGTVTITLAAVETAKLVADKRFWDIQKLVGGVVTTPRSGRCTVCADVVRATS